jgi:hypothetical protein
MHRVVKAKRSLALAAAVVAIAAGVPAMAGASSAETRDLPPSLTINFNGSNDEAATASAVGVGFGGKATAKDAAGNEVGTVYDSCDKDAINVNSVEAFCHADIVFNGGDQVAFSVVFPIQNPLTAHYPDEFDGVITGGTGNFKGITGSVHFTNTSLAVYNVDWRS